MSKPVEAHALSRSVLRSKGQLTLPREIREAAHIAEGDPVEIEVVAEGILLRPQKMIDAAQAWFWTPGWQAGEVAASKDVEAGRTQKFASGEDFLASIED